jgi:hypothetical protein
VAADAIVVASVSSFFLTPPYFFFLYQYYLLLLALKLKPATDLFKSLSSAATSIYERFPQQEE